MKYLLAGIFIGLSLFAIENKASAQDAALENAKSAIKAYFDAILDGETTLQSDMAKSTAIQAVPSKDQDALQDYYDQISLSSAQKAVDVYAQTVKAGKDSSTVADQMHEIEDALSPENLKKINIYYKQKGLK